MIAPYAPRVPRFVWGSSARSLSNKLLYSCGAVSHHFLLGTSVLK